MFEHFYTCPYCFTEVSLLIDRGRMEQEYIEDCERCCNPIRFRFKMNGWDDMLFFEAVSLEQ